MSGIWISAATIARFAVAGSLMTLMAGGQSAPKAARTIVEQTDVLEKLGLPRGGMFFAARETPKRFPTHEGT